MAEKTKEQASAVSEAVVTSVNTVATKTVEEVENIAVTSGVVHKVRPGPQSWLAYQCHPFPGPQRGQLGRWHHHPIDIQGNETQGLWWSVLGVFTLTHLESSKLSL